MVALCLSGSVLVMTFWPAVRDDHPKVIMALLSAIVVLNVLLAVGCKVNVLVIVNVKDMENKSLRQNKIQTTTSLILLSRAATPSWCS